MTARGRGLVAVLVLVAVLWGGLLPIARPVGAGLGRVLAAGVGPGATPTAVIAGLGGSGSLSQAGVYVSPVAPYSLVPPAHWVPRQGQDQSTGTLYDVYVASPARVLLVVAFGPGLDVAGYVQSKQQAGYAIHVVGHVRVAGHSEPIYSYRDKPGDQPPFQEYGVVFLLTAQNSWVLLLASDPGHFAADLGSYRAALRTFRLRSGV